MDLSKHTSNSFYSGAKKLLGKQTIYSLHIQDGLLFAGGSSVDGTAGKVCKLLVWFFLYIASFTLAILEIFQ